MTITDDRVDSPLIGSAAPRRAAPGRKAWLVAAALAGAALVVLAVGVGVGSGGGASGGGDRAAVSAPNGVTGGGTSSSVAAAPAPVHGADQAGGPELPAAPNVVVDKVVRTGEIDLEVAKGQVPHMLDRLIALATLERGFVADSHSTEGESTAGGAPSGSVTLRVPVQVFDATVTEVRHLPATVLSQQSAAADVTSDYVDLQARIHSLTATRASFERLLERATTIGDTLAVQSRVTDVQTQIEQLQGRLRVLADQATYATLTVTVGEVGTKAAPRHGSSGMSRALHRSWNRFAAGSEAIVGILGPLVLVAIVAALVWMLARLAVGRLRRRAVSR